MEEKFKVSERFNVFKMTDLTNKEIASRGGRIGSVGYVGPDQDPDDFSPISPWVMFSKVIGRLDYIDRVDVAKLDVEALDSLALEIGRAVVAGKFFPGTSYCTIDMPTCARNERISRVATFAESITNLDVGILREQMEFELTRIKHVDRRMG